MIPVVVSIVFAVLAFAAAMVGVVVILQRVVPKRIGRRHEVLEEILDTKQPPSSWGNSHGRQLARLRRLRSYVTVSTLVESEELRADLLIQLDSIRDGWLAESGSTDQSSQRGSRRD